MPVDSHRRGPRRSITTGIASATVLGLGLVTSANAQDYRKHLTLNGIMSATTAPQGLAFVALSATDQALTDGTSDGSMALGFGFGNADEKLGLQVTLNLTSLAGDGTGPTESGYLTLKFSKRLGEVPLYLGLQIDGLAPWGDAAMRSVVIEGSGGGGGEEGGEGGGEVVSEDVLGVESVEPSVKLALSYFTDVGARGGSHPLMFTLGVGNRVRNFERDPGVFAGVGVGLGRNLAASVAWSGDYFDLGIGYRMGNNLFLNATLNDAFDTKDRQRVTLTVAYTFNMFGG